MSQLANTQSREVNLTKRVHTPGGTPVLPRRSGFEWSYLAWCCPGKRPSCDPEEWLWYEFLLMTGMREQEVMYTYWPDVNFAANSVQVNHKPSRNWM